MGDNLLGNGFVDQVIETGASHRFQHLSNIAVPRTDIAVDKLG